MLPIKSSTIFKSRWWALLWAAGVCWTAVEVAQGAAGDGGNASANASAPSSSDDPVDPATAQKAAALLRSFS